MMKSRALAALLSLSSILHASAVRADALTDAQASVTANIHSGVSGGITAAKTAETLNAILSVFPLYAPLAGGTFTGPVSIPFTQSGTGAVASTVDAKLKRAVKNVVEFNADISGATDAAAAVNACLTSLSPTGGTCQIAASDKIKITSADIVIPKNVTLSCSLTSPGLSINSGYDFGDRGGIRLSSSRTIQNSGTIENCMIYRDGMTFPTADSSAFAGTAITCAADNATARNLLILGFNLAISCNGQQRVKISDVNTDSQGGVLFCNSTDSSVLYNVHAWPFATIAAYTATPTVTIIQRTGIGIETCGQNDDTRLDNVLALGYYRNFKIAGAGNINIGRMWSDYTTLSATTSRGVWLAHSGTVNINQLFVGNSVQPLYIDSPANVVNIDTTFITATGVASGTATESPICVVVDGSAKVTFKYLQINGCATWQLYQASTTARTVVLAGNGENFGNGTITGAGTPYLGIASGVTTNNFRVSNYITGQTAGTALIGGNPLNLPTIASAAALLLTPDCDEFRVTGVTAITSISGGYGKREVELQFAGIVTVTHGVSLLLAGAANFNTTAGSRVRFRYDPLQNAGAGGWIELWRRII